jgi:hypothetical protein
MAKKDRWVPLVQVPNGHLSERTIAIIMKEYHLSRADAIRHADEDDQHCTTWINDLYQVQVRRLLTGYGRTLHLNIRRRDGKPIFRDWRHFQRIKNELVGPEFEGVELYPAESRLSDAGNKYHIYCVVEPGFKFPFGFQERDVRDEIKGNPGTRQRAL